MRTSKHGILVGAALWLAATAGADAANWVVQVGGSRLAYSPMELTIAPGDTVTFRNMGGVHNVTADDGSFRCAQGCDGQGGNGAASGQIWTATVSFPTAGRFGYFCEPHGAPGSGMYGVVTVLGDPPVPVPTGGLALGLLLIGVAAAAVIWRRRG